MRFLLSAFLLVGSLSACYGEETYSWNQRMTVTVETPDGLVTGSSVIEVRASYRGRSGGVLGNEVHYRHSGEAVVLEVAPGRWLFVLNDNPAELVYRASPDGLGGIPLGDRGEWLRAIPRSRGLMTLPEELYPRFVTFGDIDDPLTADIFEAGEMAEVFGPGYAIASVTLEVVEAPMEVGRIEEVLPWLEAIWPNLLDGRRTQIGEAHPHYSPATADANQLGVGSFSTEIIE